MKIVKDESAGPIEELKWVNKLQASVVTPGFRPKIHGYDIRAEMVGKASFSEVIYLSLTGELPEKAVLQVFDCVMNFLAPITVAEAPVHATLLSGLCGTGTSGMTGVAAITLAEKATWTISNHLPLFEILSEDQIIIPEQYFSNNFEEIRETSYLIDAIKKIKISFPEEFAKLKPFTAALAVLYKCCAITETNVLEILMVIAMLPCTIAEGQAVKPGDFRTYPIELPPFQYTDEKL